MGWERLSKRTNEKELKQIHERFSERERETEIHTRHGSDDRYGDSWMRIQHSARTGAQIWKLFIACLIDHWLVRGSIFSAYHLSTRCSFVHFVFWIFYLKLIVEKENKRKNREHTHTRARIYHSASRRKERERKKIQSTQTKLERKHHVNVFLIIDR